MSRSPAIIALLDANVLYPAPLRDYLLHLASLGVFEPLWTAAIQEEWIRNLLDSRPDLRGESLEGAHRAMDKAFPGSNVTDYESLTESLVLPDPNDRHVFAAAIKHPDSFISGCIDRDRPNALKALENQIKALKTPPMSREKVLSNLEGNGLVLSAAKLRHLGGLFPE
jgi:PIN domain